MIIDCHAHWDPRVLNEQKLLQKMDEQGIARVALIPRITEAVEPEKSTFLLSAQRALMNSNILRPIAQAASETFYDDQGSLRAIWRPFTHESKGYVKALAPDNASIAEIIQKHPDRLLGWIMLNPVLQPDPLAELERWRKIPGMIGVKLHPYWHKFSLRSTADILARAQELSLPVLIHLGFGSQGDFRWLLTNFPTLNVIFAHAGIPYFKALWPSVQTHSHAYVDLSSPHVSESFVQTVVQAIGPLKCLYGTDSPYGFGASRGDYDYGHVKGWIDHLSISRDAREKILGENFRQLIHV